MICEVDQSRNSASIIMAVGLAAVEEIIRQIGVADKSVIAASDTGLSSSWIELL